MNSTVAAGEQYQTPGMSCYVIPCHAMFVRSFQAPDHLSPLMSDPRPFSLLLHDADMSVLLPDKAARWLLQWPWKRVLLLFFSASSVLSPCAFRRALWLLCGGCPACDTHHPVPSGGPVQQCHVPSRRPRKYGTSNSTVRHDARKACCLEYDSTHTKCTVWTMMLRTGGVQHLWRCLAAQGKAQVC